mmetsp:Transcript_51634/g.70924  ORF Transcript_51634/g.70924 Transcript_51634/m.70924 type:complete len:88 (+) Transcript_51634:260-523(+)
MVITQKIQIRSLVEIFAARCYVHGRRLNLVTHEFYDEALKIAEAKQDELAKAKKEGTVDKLGCYFGLPVAIKDQYHEKGKPCLTGSI